MGERESIPRGPHENASYQGIAGIQGIPQQDPEISQTEHLAKNRGGLDRAAILGRQKVGPGKYNALYRCRQATVSQVRSAAEHLFEKRRIATHPLDTLGRK